MRFFDVTSAPSEDCMQRYVTSFFNKLSNICNDSSVTGVDESQTEISTSHEQVNNQLRVIFKLPLLPYGLSTSSYTSCSDIIMADFLNVSQTTSRLTELAAAGCPTLLGTPLVSSTSVVCEGRGTFDITDGVCKVCPPGTSYNSTGQCQLCPAGTYQNVSGEITCEPCPPETWTEGTGKTSLEQCIRECPGEFVSDTGFPPCRHCPVNMYKTNSTHCVSCEEGTLHTGSDHPLLSDCTECFCAKMCPPGSFSYTGYEPNCRSCPTGYFSTTPGAKQCQECPPGHTTHNPNSTFCVEASSVLCHPGPCRNKGVCRIIKHSEECDCLPGTSGRICDVLIDTCKSFPCYNDGTCLSNGTDFSCSCVPGFTGSRCETNINDCKPGECGEGGVCIDKVGSWQCLCVEGFSGSQCEKVDAKPCERFPCKNGGTCVQENPFWRTCQCQPEFEGEDCEREAVQVTCDSSPCVNGGTCSASQNGVVCSCLVGFSGQRCEFRNQTCATRECGPSVGCVDDPVSGLSWCICEPGYELTSDTEWTEWFNTDSPADGSEVELISTIRSALGSVCFDVIPLEAECRIQGQTTLVTGPECTETGITCTSSPCPDYEVRFKCQAIVAYKDSVCTLVDHCSKVNMCVNKGRCENVQGGYQCVCPPQFTGAHCQLPIRGCDGQPCLHGGTCTEEGGTFTCQCVAGYTGVNCETNIDDCASNPCDTTGTDRCEDGVDEFTCICLPGYSGGTCEMNIDECISAPCLHAGTCVDGISSFSCRCPAEWTGQTCDVLIDRCTISNPCSSNGVCYSLFDDTYCHCQGGASGSTCEIVPDMCKTANHCVSPATCINNGTTPWCQCPKGRAGYDCGLLASVECSSTECQNGGTCRRTQAGDTQCVCVRGYEGSKCEVPVDHCAGVTCPLPTTCIDGQQKHFCRCPVGKSPPSCTDDINSDYDLCFVGVPTPGSAVLPYSVPVTYTDGFSITLWVRFSQPGGSGTFFSLYQDLSGGSVTSTRLFLNISEKGAHSYLDNNPILLPFLPGGQQVNDGEWHHLVVTWHTTGAVLNLVMDNVSQHQQEDFMTGLVLPSRLWVALGSHSSPSTTPGTATDDPTTFLGCVSQVNVYGRHLDINTEIAIFNTQPKYVFDSESVLRWAEYESVRSTIVSRPSTAMLNTCPSGFTNPPACTTVRRAVLIVRVLFCPDNQFLEAPTGSTRVQWQEPRFEGATSITSNYSPGVVFSTGSHVVVYEARGDTGNIATCIFTIYINSEMCPAQAKPRGGGDNSCQTTSGSWPYTLCTPTCPVSSSGLVQSGPVSYTCDPSGRWTSLDRSDGLYPACGQRMGPPSSKVTVRVTYRVWSLSCDEAQTTLDTMVRQSITNLNHRWGGALCETDSCSSVQLDISCRGPTIEVNITMPNIRSLLNNSAESLTPEQILTRAGLDENIFTFTISGRTTPPDSQTFDAFSTDQCPDGQIAVASFCYTCGPGTYHNTAINTCVNCPKGTYQNQFGSVSCQSCSLGETTPNVGNTDPIACSPLCSEGHFYNSTTDHCEKCPSGTYQDRSGQFSCIQCPAGQRTGFVGAVSLQQCTDRCQSGYELSNSGQCTECPVGTYRQTQVDVMCQDCPQGFITPSAGSVSSTQCTQVACPAGQFLDTSTNLCQLCPVGSYQERQWQTNCTSCGGERYRTDTEGATNQTQCRFFCPSGSEAVENNSVCQECSVGTYKDNSVDIYSSCLPCPDNSLTPGPGTTTVSECTIANNCPSGQQVVKGQCEDCPQGFYKNNVVNPSSACQQCPPGYVTPTTGATSVTECSLRNCSAGTRITASGDSCEPCPVQTYQPLPYQTNCLQCETGYSTNSTGSTSSAQCIRFCSSGEEMTEGGCSPCSRGTYKNNEDGLFLQCQLCPEDYITLTPGAESREACTVRNCSSGYRLNETDNTCVECGLGFYQPKQWQTKCEQCPRGTLTIATASQSASDCLLICDAGSEDRNGTCVLCPLGFFKTQQGPEPCQPCPDGFRSNTLGATAEQECNVAACDPGSYLDVVSNTCLLCGLSQYQPDKWQDNCLPCPDGLTTYNTGASRRDQCLLECESGKEYSLESGECEMCGQGYYRDAADKQDRCQLCPIETITPGPGATHRDNCTVANCSVLGQYLDVQTNQCRDCPVGTFQDQRWATACQNCSEDFTTRSTGTGSHLKCYRDCQSGTQVIEATNTCQECPVGQYRTRGQTWTCVLCEIGDTTARRGSTSVNDCRPICGPGTVLSSDSKRCEPCPLGTYQSRRNQLKCVPCPNNQTSQSSGSDSIEKCFSYCSTKAHNCSSGTVCSDRPHGFSCQCRRGYTGPPENCTHVCDLPSYCTNKGVCQRETFPSCLCPEYYTGDTCEIWLAPNSNVNSTIIGTVIGVLVFLLIIALILVGLYTRRRRRSEEASYQETISDGVSMTPSSYMTLRTDNGPFSVLRANKVNTQYDPAFYSTKQQSEVERSYISLENDRVLY